MPLRGQRCLKDGFTIAFEALRTGAQGLKPAIFAGLIGTAKAVPYPKPADVLLFLRFAEQRNKNPTALPIQPRDKKAARKSKQKWPIIPGRRLFRHHARSPNSTAYTVMTITAFTPS